MKTIGLIGGMSFESTAVYYDLLNRMARDALGGLASAEIVLHSVNFEEIVSLQRAGHWDEAGRRLGEIARGLESAGAHCVLICTNTMHKVADAVRSAVTIPVIDIIDETARAVRADEYSRPLLLATRYTMEDGFYHGQMAQHGIEVLTPAPSERDRVHAIIFDELCKGEIRDTSRAEMLAVIQGAISRGADCVILGCTEICLLLDPASLPLPGFDSTRLHCVAATNFSQEKHLVSGDERRYA